MRTYPVGLEVLHQQPYLVYASNKGSGESGQASNKGSGESGQASNKGAGESGQASNKGSGESGQVINKGSFCAHLINIFSFLRVLNLDNFPSKKHRGC